MNRKVVILMILVILSCSSINMSFATSFDDVMQQISTEVKETADQVVDQVKEEAGDFVESTVEKIKIFLTDINGHWAKDYIESLVDKKVINGYEDGTFRPDDPTRRSECIKITMAALYGEESYSNGSPWYQSYLDDAIKKGIVIPEEYDEASDGTDKYSLPITRGEIAIIIARAGEKTGRLEIDEVMATNFNDDNKIDEDMKKYIQAVNKAGIVTGYPNGNFGPGDKASRAEVSVMLQRLLDVKVEKNVEIEEPIEEDALHPSKLDPEVIEKAVENYKTYWDQFLTMPVNEERTAMTYERQNYPKINEYQYRIYKIMIYYALEKDLYAHHTNSGVALYRKKIDMQQNWSPLFEFYFWDTPMEYKGFEYNLGIRLYGLHNMKEDPNESLAEARERLIQMNFEEQYIIDAFSYCMDELFEEDKSQGIVESMRSRLHEIRDVQYDDYVVREITVAGLSAQETLDNNEVDYDFMFNYDK